MVGIVVVSHSDVLAEGVVRLAREMATPELEIVAAGGIDEPGVLGTDAERIRAAIEQASSPDGVLVMMDLGSALLSAELAIELLAGVPGPVALSDAPLVEGAVAAAVAASGGATLAEVAAEARGALAMKVGQIDAGDAASGGPLAAEAGDAVAEAGDAVTGAGASVEAGGAGAERIEAELPVLPAIGLHARPAARFVETARRFDADVRVTKSGSGAPPVSARSLTNLVALAARQGDTLLVSATGPEAQAALVALKELAAGGFGDGLEGGGAAPTGTTPPPSGRPAVPPAVPPAATAAATPAPAEPPAPGTTLHGIAASAGVAAGPAQLLASAPAGPPPARPAEAPAQELFTLERGLAQLREALAEDRERLAARAGAAEAEIFTAHLALLDDEALLAPARAAIEAGASAEAAVHEAASQVAAIYRALADPLLAERAADVVDVGRRLVAAITGELVAAVVLGGVVIADELTPSQTAGLDPEHAVAIATARGSITAHAAIIARSLGVPAVLGLGADVLAIADGTTVLVDGEAGSVTVAPAAALLEDAAGRGERRRQRAAAALAAAHSDTRLASGERIEVFANIGSVEDALRAVELGAEGVGMLRTEFLYLNRQQLPDEEEQVETLREIARALAGRPLVVRTLDAGADKPLPAVPMAPEANPFLGVRGVRVGLAQPELLLPQLRAALRVAAEHPLKLMVPMVATIAEVESVGRMLEQARAELGVKVPMELGITLEVPSAALLAARLGRELDFFSLGTNDLTQYTMAAERGNASLVGLLDSPQPAVLRLVKLIVDGAAQASATTGRRCWVGVCGEMGGEIPAAVLLVGLGVTELSMAPGLIPELKQALRSVSLADAQRAAAAALDVDDAASARGLALELL